ncbi:MAG: glycosyltransferase family 4 protein [Candidatus Omnitrophica bacterium]|nr:glycosyltransferase family 4 protein [Candidatus Omnitrophota bacterium]MCM8793319.1 glycosyltransferase family 4 protein [Candidatus Omnitrophota bacterium]
MVIGIDIRSTLKPQMTGVGQYTYNLLKNLSRIDHHHRYLLYSRIRPFSKKRNPKIRGKNFYFFTERFRQRPHLFFSKIDLYHSSSYDLIPPQGKKFVITVHDVIVKAYPEGHSLETVERINKIMASALERAEGIITVSESTKKDVVKYFGFPENKIKVIHLGAGEEFFPLTEEEKGRAKSLLKNCGVRDKFILFVGTIEPRKNLKNLLSAFNNLKIEITHQLVIVGMKGWGGDEVYSLVEKLGLRDRVVFTGYLPQKEVNFFYNLCDCFVYPSFYEGFGLPIIEAMQVGCPVITSNTSSCAEIGENSAILIEPDSVDSIAEAIFKVVKDKDLNQQLREKSLRRAKDFSWEIAAEKTLHFFEDIYRIK